MKSEKVVTVVLTSFFALGGSSCSSAPKNDADSGAAAAPVTAESSSVDLPNTLQSQKQAAVRRGEYIVKGKAGESWDLVLKAFDSYAPFEAKELGESLALFKFRTDPGLAALVKVGADSGVVAEVQPNYVYRARPGKGAVPFMKKGSVR